MKTTYEIVPSNANSSAVVASREADSHGGERMTFFTDYGLLVDSTIAEFRRSHLFTRGSGISHPRFGGKLDGQNFNVAFYERGLTVDAPQSILDKVVDVIHMNMPRSARLEIHPDSLQTKKVRLYGANK